ncbi:hypothetical protein [Clostridium senegalense]|uniref:hypothetical protein n=1 Tax=Clostridium senegalense TaxID=1465809 RepID=UPI0002891974|nr:hypothetical protein [Clostridium senegalense]
MKKIFGLISMFIMIILLVGCKYDNIDLAVKAKEPTTTPIINGQWIVNGYKPLEKSDNLNESYNVWNKSIITINTQVAIFPNNTYKNPKYKLKVVEAENYILKKYGIEPKEIGINDERISIISISSDEHYYEDVLLIDNDNAIVESNNIIYYISRIDSNDIDELKEKQNQKGVAIGNSKYSDESDLTKEKSGVFIGLKETTKMDTYPLIFKNYIDKMNEFSYRTLWVNFDGENVEIKEIPYIFLVRKNGFWKVESERVSGNDYIQDNITAIPLNKKDEENNALKKEIRNGWTYGTIEINFIANDYMCVETHGNNVDYENEKFDYENLETIPIDTVYSGEMKSISISKILGKEQLEVVNEEIMRINNKTGSINKEDYTKDFWGFGVERVPGKWGMKGRVNQDLTNNDYADFQIPIDVPQTLLKYDSVYLPLAKVKEQVPRAKDVICSPNKDMAVVFTDEKILVYKIVGTNLSDSPLGEFDLKENEKLIMAEWATGDYVDQWDKEVNENLE